MKRVEEVEVERRGKKLEVLNFLEMWCFFSLFFIMMICMTSPLEHFFFSTLSACKYVSTERAVRAAQRLLKSGNACLTFLPACTNKTECGFQ